MILYQRERVLERIIRFYHWSSIVFFLVSIFLPNMYNLSSLSYLCCLLDTNLTSLQSYSVVQHILSQQVVSERPCCLTATKQQEKTKKRNYPVESKDEVRKSHFLKNMASMWIWMFARRQKREGETAEHHRWCNGISKAMWDMLCSRVCSNLNMTDESRSIPL